MVMKRMVAPKFWPVERKTKKYVIEPRPGPHSKYFSVPLGVILRDILRYAFSTAESRHILNAGHVLVDGKLRREVGFPVGLMDIVTVGEEHYRVLTTKRGLALMPIDKKEAGIKLCRLEGKTSIKKGKIQAHLHDGHNMILENAKYKTGDVLVFDTATKKIKDVIKLEKGSRVLIIRGNNMGSLGTVEDVVVTKSSMPNQVVVDIGPRKIALPHTYVFAVGRPEPVIKLGEAR
jgi:small subunit ribosomal protein S4e